MQTTRQELKRRLDRLRTRVDELTRGKSCYPPKVARMMEEIDIIKGQIAEIDNYAMRYMAYESIKPSELLEVAMIPLVADVMNDILASVEGMYSRAGLTGTIFYEHVKQIRKSTMAIIDLTVSEAPNLTFLLDHDDTLIDALRKKLRSYVVRKLAPLDDRFKELQKQESKKR